jgi:hypothetical protein
VTNKTSEKTNQYLMVPDYLRQIFINDAESDKPTSEKLNTVDYFVYEIFLRKFNQNRGYAWIGNNAIAKMCGKTPRTITSSIQKLVSSNLISRSPIPREANHSTQTYRTVPLIRINPQNGALVDEREIRRNPVHGSIQEVNSAAEEQEIDDVPF